MLKFEICEVYEQSYFGRHWKKSAKKNILNKGKLIIKFEDWNRFC